MTLEHLNIKQYIGATALAPERAPTWDGKSPHPTPMLIRVLILDTKTEFGHPQALVTPRDEQHGQRWVRMSKLTDIQPVEAQS